MACSVWAAYAVQSSLCLALCRLCGLYQAALRRILVTEPLLIEEEWKAERSFLMGVLVGVCVQCCVFTR